MSRALPSPFRRADGLWVARWTDATGKRRQVTSRDVEDVIEKRRRRLAGYDDQQTVGEYLTWWTATYLPRRVRDGRMAHRTAERYEQLVRVWLLSADLDSSIVNIRLADLTGQHIDDLLDEVGRIDSPQTHRPLSPRTVQYIHATLRTALTVARRRRLIDRNPAADVEAPSPTDTDRTILQPEQVGAFLTACSPDRFGALWTVVLPLGLRIGEALALSVDDYNADDGTLRVARSLAETTWGGQRTFVYKPTKTHAAATYELPRFARAAIERRLEIRDLERMIAGSAWSDAALVDDRGQPVTVPLLFCREDGSPMRYRTAHKALARLCTAAGLPALTPHELRHATASILAAQGADLTMIQKLLRHRRQALTSDLYTHLVASVQRGAAARMDDLVDGSEGPQVQ